MDISALEALFSQGHFAAAIDHGAAFLAQNPASFAAHNIVGKANAMLGRTAQAADSFRAALAINPDFAIGHNNMANILKQLGRTDEAIASYRRALTISPDDFLANKNLAILLHELGRVPEAVAAWRETLRVRPEFSLARAHMIHQLAHMCDWEALAAEEDAIPALGVTGEFVPPFTMLSRDDDPARHLRRAEKCAASQFSAIMANAFPEVLRPAAPTDRICIGYFGADFHDHATMSLMVPLLEAYDRSRFAIHVYSYGPATDDGMQRRAKAAVDKFHDVRTMSDRDVATLARNEGVDIAVDLKGYTTDARLGILAWRPAPVQMSYLGYPGTLGAPFIDYIVADRVVIPDEQRRHYSESVIYLPDSYQPNDDARVIADRAPTRAEAGLPDEGVVFCCFNNNFKVTPDEFDIWMRLLRKVDGSVLWLLKVNPWALANLRKEAERRGVDPDRLIFAERAPWPEHLARQRLADMFLDTFRYNAHTTASDALWAGVPVVTLAGRYFFARVAASVLTAVGLPELITGSARDYEALALALATDRDRLEKIRAKLWENRLTTPLFDSALFVRNLEKAYEQAYRNWFEGEGPRDIAVQ